MRQPDYEPRRFRANVPYYARFRLGYPDALIDENRGRAWPQPAGCGDGSGGRPGLLAIAFARAGMAVTAIDPEPDMLTALRKAAAESGVTLDVRLGSSFDMPQGIGPFRLVTIGRAFHWMDRSATLQVLDGLIAADGALVLVHDEHPATAENTWRSLLRELADKYGRAQAPHVRAARAPEYRSHESPLLDSAFSRLERVGIIIRRELTADDIVGLGFSLSVLSPERLRERASAFEAELRRDLAHLSPDGRFTEIAELSALIARRP